MLLLAADMTRPSFQTEHVDVYARGRRSWFASAASNANPSLQKGVKSIILLTIWRLWKSRNDVIFKNLTINRKNLVLSILEKLGFGCWPG
jgi:hypothetical protein